MEEFYCPFHTVWGSSFHTLTLATSHPEGPTQVIWVILPIAIFDLCRIKDSHGTAAATLLALAALPPVLAEAAAAAILALGAPPPVLADAAAAAVLAPVAHPPVLADATAAALLAHAALPPVLALLVHHFHPFCFASALGDN